MFDDLFPHYERELRYINLLTQEFANRHPGAATRLGLETTGSSDPYVERLLETFALLAARNHAKIDDEFPELTDSLLQFLYPHYLAPIPPMSLVQFDADPSRVQLPGGFLIPRGSTVSAATEPIACKFRSAFSVKLWPIRVNNASFRAPPFPPGVQPPLGTAAALRLELECSGEQSFTKLQIPALRFFLSGDPQMIPDLHEVILNQALQVVFVPDRADKRRSPIVLNPEACLHPVGFHRDEGLFPYQENSRMGYRLLTEFFTFPAKFQFFDLTGWSHLAAAGFGQKCEVIIFCGRTHQALEQGVDGATFRLGCTPVVNLFDKTAEPISLRSRQHEYRIVADHLMPDGFEIYSVTGVSSSDPTKNRTTRYPYFFGLDHPQASSGHQIYWYTKRRRSLRENDRGSELYLSLVNLQFEARWPADESIQIQTVCTNRDHSYRVTTASRPVNWTVEMPAPLSRVNCLRLPSPALRPPARTGGQWELISHLSPNPLSLQEGPPGRAALYDILRLYDFSDPAAGQKHLRDQAQEILEGLISVNHRRVLGRVPSDPGRGLCRGIEITVELDRQKFPVCGAFLFAAVLERFFGLYATTNSFTQLVAKTPQQVIKKWPPRTGEIPLL